MKKFLSLVLALAMILSCVSMVSFVVNAEEAATLGDGTVESGTKGWGVWNGGTNNGAVVDPDDANNKVFSFTPKGEYNSAFFDLGPYIINDPEHGYEGNGGGLYRISFRYRAHNDADLAHITHDFSFQLQSQNHMSAANVQTLLPSATFTYNTYLGGGTTQTFDKQWKTFTADISVSQDWHDMMVAIYNAGKTNTYQIGTRIDASKNFYALDNEGNKIQATDAQGNPKVDNSGKPVYTRAYFSYYMDDVTIEYLGTPVGYEFTKTGATKDIIRTNNSPYAKMTLAEAVDGVITRSYDVYNNSEKAVSVFMYFQRGWNSLTVIDESAAQVPALTHTLTIPAYGKKTFTYSFPLVLDGGGNPTEQIANVKYGNDTNILISALTLRFELEASVTEGTELWFTASEGSHANVLTSLDNLGNYSGSTFATKTSLSDIDVANRKREVVNADAEKGTVGWGVMNCDGSVTNVVDPVDPTNKVIKFTPTGSIDKYASVRFNLGPAIINDIENGCAGSGAGVYTVSFRAKAEEGKGGNFTGYINSDLHLQEGNKYGDYVCTTNTFANGETITMTDSWATYSFTVTLSNRFMENIFGCYSAGAKQAYNLDLRLAGEGGAYASADYFTYYIDDVTITYKPLPTAAPTAAPTPEPVGVQLSGANTYVTTKGQVGIFENDETFTGVISKTYTVYNTSSKSVSVTLDLQVVHKKSDGNNTWTSAGKLETVLIPAGMKANLTASVEVVNGRFNVTAGGATAEHNMGEPFLRINYTFTGGNKAEDTIIVAANEDVSTDPIYNLNISGVRVSELPEMNLLTPSPTPTPIPETVAGMKFEVKEEITKGYPYFRTNAHLTEADFDNGTFTKEFDVYNVSDVDLVINIQYQDGWNGFGVTSAASTKLVPANSKKTFTITFDLNDDGTLGTTKALLANITFRTQIENKPTGALPAGAAYIIAAEKGDVIYNITQGTVQPFDPKVPAIGRVGVSAVTELPELNEVTYDFKGASVDLGSTLSIKYTVDFGGIDLQRLAQNGFPVLVRFTRNGENVDVKNYTVDSEGNFVFTYEGLNAQCMGDIIDARVYLADFVLVSKLGYSVKEYATNLYNNKPENYSDEKYAALKTLLAEMLNYGAEAQKFIGYNEGKLVNEGTEEWTNLDFVVPTGTRDIEGNDEEGAKVISVGLNISNVYKIYFRVENTAENVVVKLNGEEVEVVDGKVYTDAIKATEAEKDFILTIEKDTVEVSRVTYDVNAYIEKMNDDGIVGGITKAISTYSNAATAFVNAQ